MLGVLLLSGGLDSTTTGYWARKKGFDLIALTFNYGQRHRIEVERAKQLAQAMGCQKHLCLSLPLDEIGGSALTDPQKKVPENRKIDDTIPPTYVPARNLIFLSVASAVAEVYEAEAILIGANCIDYSGYPDCRPEFLRAFARALQVGTRRGVEGHPIQVEAPLLTKTKGEIIQLARDLGVDLALTLSCYQPSKEGKPCGVCDACILRAKGFQEAGIKDPAWER